MLRLGILKCDSVRPEFQARFGDFENMFQRMFSSVNAHFEYRVYQVTAGEFPRDVKECDAYLITGSRWGVYDDLPWIEALHRFIRHLHAEKARTVGICFGHQIIANALGGKAEKAARGWRVGTTRTHLQTTADFIRPELAEFTLCVSHQDQVTRLPSAATLLASSDCCPHAAYYVGEHMLAFQGHPEFPADYVAGLIDMRREILGETIYKDGKASLERATDQQTIAAWIGNFLAR